MKTKLSILLTLVIAVVCVSTVRISKGSASTEPQIPVMASEPAEVTQESSPTMFDIPDTAKCCLFQVDKRAKGVRVVAATGNSYDCPTGPTRHFPLRISIRFGTAGAPCDQRPGFIPDGSSLQASGFMIWRNDGFAHFIGDFIISDPNGRTLFKGRMETIDRSGSHHLFGCERCNQLSHVEGWLVGAGVDQTSNLTLRATIAARGTAPNPPANLRTSMAGSLTGAIIKCPQ